MKYLPNILMSENVESVPWAMLTVAKCFHLQTNQLYVWGNGVEKKEKTFPIIKISFKFFVITFLNEKFVEEN